MRFGGRLESSDLDYDSKHQIILSKRSFHTNVIVHEMHHLYAGATFIHHSSRSAEVLGHGTDSMVFKKHRTVQKVYQRSFNTYRHTEWIASDRFLESVAVPQAPSHYRVATI